MRIFHCVLILAFAILLKNVYLSRTEVNYRLAVQWPPGVCSSNDDCKTNQVPTEFTIHGLWPNQNGYANAVIIRDELQEIVSELIENWPNLNGTNLEFWQHEWNKHGSISGMDRRNYFKKALKLFKDDCKGLKAKLARKNITPSNTYKLKDIKDALRKINGFDCTVRCNQRKTSNDKQIKEIWFKYDKDFNKVNDDGLSTCGDDDTDVMFPLM